MKIKKNPVFVYVYVYTLYVCDYLAMQKIQCIPCFLLTYL